MQLNVSTRPYSGTRLAGLPVLNVLSWDTEFFGFTVAELAADSFPDNANELRCAADVSWSQERRELNSTLQILLLLNV